MNEQEFNEAWEKGTPAEFDKAMELGQPAKLRVIKAESADAFFDALDAIATDKADAVLPPGWDESIDEIVQIILRKDAPPAERAAEAVSAIEERIRAEMNIPYGRLPIPPEWEHRLPA